MAQLPASLTGPNWLAYGYHENAVLQCSALIATKYSERSLNVYALAALAAAFNIATVYFMKASDGMTKLWPSIGVVVTILITQWLIARMLVSGVPVAVGITTVVVTVMVGSALIGFAFGERPTLLQGFGYVLAMAGVSMINLSGTAR